jgi:hypothetical protein
VKQHSCLPSPKNTKAKKTPLTPPLHHNNYSSKRYPSCIIPQRLLLPLPPPHPLKLPHKSLLHPLIPRPRLTHLLHAQRSNNRETHGAKRRLLFADRRVGRDAYSFEKAEVGGVAARYQSVGKFLSFTCVKGKDLLPFVVHLDLHEEPALGPDQTFAEAFFSLAASAEEGDLLR